MDILRIYITQQYLANIQNHTDTPTQAPTLCSNYQRLLKDLKAASLSWLLLHS